MSEFLFVAGCPRSGTSFFQTVLNSHPEIAVGLERYNLKLFNRTLGLEDFEADRFFDIRPGDTWYKTLDQFSRNYKDIQPKYETAKFVGDKVPRLYTEYEYLFSAFGSKFITCFRDIRQVALSYENRRAKKVSWNPDWDFRQAVKDWNTSISATLQAMRYLPILPVLTEEMTEGTDLPEKVGEFLGIDPMPLATFLREGARNPKPKSGDAADQITSLSAEQAEHIERHADFDSYNQIIELARNPPAYNRVNETLGGAPNVVDKYSKDDARVVDYHGWRFSGSPYIMRGPKPEQPIEDSIVCIGSAATFGRLVHRPYSLQIEERLGTAVYNLGIGGARPDTYLSDQSLTEALRRCRFAVIEATSCRGYRSSIFTPRNSHTNVGKADLELLPSMRTVKSAFGDSYFIDAVYQQALRHLSASDLSRILVEVRSAYLRDMWRLADLTRGKAVLVFFSQRGPDYVQSTTSYTAWHGGFPHFVDRSMIDRLSTMFGRYVEAVSSKGIPSELRDRETGELVDVFPRTPDPSANTYYPSQEMHDEAAEQLIATLNEMQAAGGSLLA